MIKAIDSLFGWADSAIVFLYPVLRSRCIDAHETVAIYYPKWERFSKERGWR